MKKILLILTVFAFINLYSEPIHFFAQTNNIKGILANIKFKDQVDRFGFKPIHYAARYGQFQALQVLVHEGANLHGMTLLEGATALHWAAYNSTPDMVKFLLDNGANVNAQDKMSLATPLNYSIYQNNIGAFNVLSANPKYDYEQLIDKFGRTVLHWCVLYNRPLMIARFLQDERIKKIKNKADFSGVTPLALALQQQINLQNNSRYDINSGNALVDICNIIRFLTTDSDVNLTAFETMQGFSTDEKSDNKKYEEYNYINKNQKLTSENEDSIEKSSGDIEHEYNENQFLTYDDIQTQLPEIDESAKKYIFKSNVSEPRQPETPFVSKLPSSWTFKNPKKLIDLKKESSIQILESDTPKNLDTNGIEEVKDQELDSQKYNEEESKEQTVNNRMNRAQKRKLDKERQKLKKTSTISVEDQSFIEENVQISADKSQEVIKKNQNAKVVPVQDINNKLQPDENYLDNIEKKLRKKKENISGNTELHNALSKKLSDIEYLIDEDSVKVPNAEGNYPLHFAIIHNSRYCRDILSKGADVNAKNLKDLTALIYAVNSRNIILIDLLLEFNADVSYLDIMSHKLLIELANKKENREYKFLNKLATIQYNEAPIVTSSVSKPKTSEEKLKEDFFKAVKKGQIDSVVELYNKNKTLAYLTDENGKLPIHHAASIKNAKNTKYLVVLEFLVANEPKSFFMIPDINGKTAMHVLFDTANYEICSTFITHITPGNILQNIRVYLPQMKEYCQKCLDLATENQNHALIDEYKFILGLLENNIPLAAMEELSKVDSEAKMKKILLDDSSEVNKFVDQIDTENCKMQ